MSEKGQDDWWERAGRKVSRLVHSSRGSSRSLTPNVVTPDNRSERRSANVIQTPPRPDETVANQSSLDHSTDINRYRFQLWKEAEAKVVDKVGVKTWSDWQSRQTKTWDDEESSVKAITGTLNAKKAKYRADQWAYERDGRKVPFTDVIDHVLVAIDNTKLILRSAAAIDPFHAAPVVWAGVEVLITAARDNKAILSMILDDADFTTYAISAGTLWEESALSSDKSAPSGSTQLLRDTLVQTYSEILQYQMRAYDFLEEPKLLSGFKGMLKPKAERSVPRLNAKIRDSFTQMVEGAGLITISDKLEGVRAAVVQGNEGILSLSADILDRSPNSVHSLPALKLLNKQAQGTAGVATDVLQSVELVHLGGPPNPHEQKNRKGAANTGYKIDTVDLWRLLVSSVSRSEWSQGDYPLTMTVFPSSAERDLTTVTQHSLDVTVSLTQAQLGPAVTMRPQDISFENAPYKFPTRELAQHLLQKQTLPIDQWTGVTGEKYIWPKAQRPSQLFMPTSLCIVRMPACDIVCFARDLERAVTAFQLIVHAAKMLWDSDQSILLLMTTIQHDATRFKTHLGNGRWLSPGDSDGSYHKLTEKVQTFYASVLMAEGTGTVIPDVDNTPEGNVVLRNHEPIDPYDMQVIQECMQQGLSELTGSKEADPFKQSSQNLANTLHAYYADHAKWLLLAMSLNLYTNLRYAESLQTPLEDLFRLGECWLAPS
ncbi:hypothetical protein LTR86_000429 [Recurvomyces mirabilis]|nr:hypothetical protein LTR86_000429 [Recurvomyces mirabilis]